MLPFSLRPASAQDYESMPVEEFGKALLRGLGWADGQGVGRKRQVGFSFVTNHAIGLPADTQM